MARKPRTTHPDGTFTARRPSACAWCPDPIAPGQTVTGRRGHGWVHLHCAAAIDSTRAASTP